MSRKSLRICSHSRFANSSSSCVGTCVDASWTSVPGCVAPKYSRSGASVAKRIDASDRKRKLTITVVAGLPLAAILLVYAFFSRRPLLSLPPLRIALRNVSPTPHRRRRASAPHPLHPDRIPP